MGNILAKILLTIIIIFLLLLSAIKFEIITVPEDLFKKTTSNKTDEIDKDNNDKTNYSNKIVCKITQTKNQTLGGTQGEIKSEITYTGEFEDDILIIISSNSVSTYNNEQSSEITTTKDLLDVAFTPETEKYSGIEYKSTIENNTLTLYLKYNLNELDSQNYFGERDDEVTTSLVLGENGPEIKPGSINKTTFINTLQSEGYTCK